MGGPRIEACQEVKITKGYERYSNRYGDYVERIVSETKTLCADATTEAAARNTLTENIAGLCEGFLKCNITKLGDVSVRPYSSFWTRFFGAVDKALPKPLQSSPSETKKDPFADIPLRPLDILP